MGSSVAKVCKVFSEPVPLTFEKQGGRKVENLKYKTDHQKFVCSKRRGLVDKDFQIHFHLFFTLLHCKKEKEQSGWRLGLGRNAMIEEDEMDRRAGQTHL